MQVLVFSRSKTFKKYVLGSLHQLQSYKTIRVMLKSDKNTMRETVNTWRELYNHLMWFCIHLYKALMPLE